MKFNKDIDKNLIKQKVDVFLEQYDKIQETKNNKEDYSSEADAETKLAAYVWDMHVLSKDVALKNNEKTILAEIADRKLDTGDDYSYFHAQIIEQHENIQKAKSETKDVICSRSYADTPFLYIFKDDFLSANTGDKNIKDVFNNITNLSNKQAEASAEDKNSIDFKKALTKQAVILSDFSDEDIRNNADMYSQSHTDAILLVNDIKLKCEKQREIMKADIPVLSNNIDNIKNTEIINIAQADINKAKFMSELSLYDTPKSFKTRQATSKAMLADVTQVVDDDFEIQK